MVVILHLIDPKPMRNGGGGKPKKRPWPFSIAGMALIVDAARCGTMDPANEPRQAPNPITALRDISSKGKPSRREEPPTMDSYAEKGV